MNFTYHEIQLFCIFENENSKTLKFILVTVGFERAVLINSQFDCILLAQRIYEYVPNGATEAKAAFKTNIK